MFRNYEEIDDIFNEQYILKAYMFFSFFVAISLYYLSFMYSYLVFFIYCYVISNNNFYFTLKTYLIFLFLQLFIPIIPIIHTIP